MAGDWIKMRVDLADDPAVIAISDATGIDEDSVVGKLHRLWSWADRQTRDGNAAGVTGKWVDRYLSCDGFACAMGDAGWLDEDGANVTIPNFDRHNGKSGKSRALTAKRVAKLKIRVGNAGSVTTALPREEKRREEKSIKSNTPLPPLPKELDNEDFRIALTEWLAYKKNSYKPQGLAALVTVAARRSAEHGVQAVIDAMLSARANGWKGWDQPSSFDQRTANGKPSATKPQLPTPEEQARWNPVTGIE